MTSRNFLLEIGTEEIPARFMSWAIDELARIAEDELKERRIPHGAIRVTGTPRRIVLTVAELADQQEDYEEQVKGPPKTSAIDENGEYTKAALGFAKSRGVEVDALRFETVGNAEYLFATVREAGRPTADVMPDALVSILKKTVFPKNMYWLDPTVRFARPVRWLVALYGDEEVPFEWGGIVSGRTSRGHRFMGPASVEVPSADAYFETLEGASVIADHERRIEMIKEGIKSIEGERWVHADEDSDLMLENAFLVEYPVPFAGGFDERYLEIPEEVLIATMKKNQRYFPTRDRDGKLAASFIGVSNNMASDMHVVSAGNERVLRARLDDAAFFWREDRGRTLESRVPDLKKVTYQEKLGSVYDKCERVRMLADAMAEDLDVCDKSEKIERAAYLSKADLVTGMVFEFPEVQGVMGREYAKLDGEDPEVAEALFEQYLPRYAGDRTATGIVGAIIGICDRVDSIVAIHKAGLAPTGSQDPYALRRAARGINETIWAKQLDLDISALFRSAAKLLGADDKAVKQAEAFFRARMQNQLRERGFGHGTTSLAVSSMGARPLQALRMLNAFDAVSGEEWFASLIQSSVRVSNILGKLSEPDKALMLRGAGAPSAEQEVRLADALKECGEHVESALETSDWQEVCRALSELSPAISGFFDGVMVMDKDDTVRATRLALLGDAKKLFDRIGDFSVLKQ